MDMTEIRRMMMGAIAQMADVLPSYLKHYGFKFTENTKECQIAVGDAHNAVLISDRSITTNPSVNTVMNGVLNFANNSMPASLGRIVVIRTNGSLDYYTPTSSGGQSWSYNDGVLTISNTSGWVFGANVQYDVFYW